MKLEHAYIISWFGDPSKPDLIDRRRKIHQEQLEWCWARRITPVVFAQNYEDDWYSDGDVVYIKHQGDVLLPGPARNRLLKRFYASDNDIGLFLDNDTTLYQGAQHGNSTHIIEILRDMTTVDFEGVDILAAINPARTPFSGEIANDEYKDNLVLNRTYRFNGACFFLKNQSDPMFQFYFDEDNFEREDGTLITCEEYDFCITALRHGCGCYVTHDIILREPGRNFSTWVDDDSARDLREAYDVINNKHGVEFFNVRRPTQGKYGYIGYATNKKGEDEVFTAFDADEKYEELEKKGYTDADIQLLPDLDTPDEALAALREEDAFLDALLEQHPIKASKLGKAPVRFDWDKIENLKTETKLLLPKPEYWRS